MRVVHINSADRENITGSSHSDFTVRLKYPITNELYVVLLRASIPKTWYLINPGNYFTLVEGNSSVNISLPEGNYGITAFLKQVQTLLTQNLPNHYIYNILANTCGANWSFDTSKFTFKVSTILEGAMQPRFVFYNTLFEQFGFEKNSTYLFSNNTLIAPNVYNINLENTVFIHSDICKGMDDNVLQEIYTVGVLSDSYIEFENNMPSHYIKAIRTSGSDSNTNLVHFS